MLDVSLRDGGHRNNFHFTPLQLKNILLPLNASGIDCIEVGYRNGSLHPIDNLGRAGFCKRDYLEQCKALLTTTKMGVMAHPENVNENDLRELKACGVDLLRICVSKGDLQKALPVLLWAKQLDMAISMNFIHLSYYQEAELDELIEQMNRYQPNMVYFADSNGSLYPFQVRKIYQRYTSTTCFPLGFHAHDNLGLAMANTLAALEAGASYVDAALAGMGKGIGNLKTELFTAYLTAIKKKTYQLSSILQGANYVREALKIGQEPIEMSELLRGILNLSTRDMQSHLEKTAVL